MMIRWRLTQSARDVDDEQETMASWSCAWSCRPHCRVQRDWRCAQLWYTMMGVMPLVIAAGGLAVALFAVKGLLRLRRSARPRIDVGVVSDAWLAEQRGARK